MLAFHVELLTGRYSACEYNDRDTAEWPPHPARLFSALVATAAEEPDDDKRHALEWLESQPAPSIAASPAFRRTVMRHYVPTNDVQTVSEPEDARRALFAVEAELAGSREAKAKKKLEKAAAKLRSDTSRAISPTHRISKEDLSRADGVLLDSRGKQPRTFPSVFPEDPQVTYIWPEPPPTVRRVLGELAARLVRLGHSSTLVRAWVDDEVQEALWRPDDSGSELLRVASAGQLNRLEAAFELHRETEPRVLPARFQRYRSKPTMPTRVVAQSPFGDEWIVFRRVGGPRLPSLRTVDVARAMRGTLMAASSQPPPSVLSGHFESGEPLDRPHVAFLALPNVGHEHADGSVLGVAVVLPRNLDASDRRSVMNAVGQAERLAAHSSATEPGQGTVPIHLRMGRSGDMEVERVEWAEPSVGLRPHTWCSTARTFVTATPMALDRNPGDLNDANTERRRRAFEEAEESVARACENQGLPRPTAVEVSRSVLLTGTSKPRAFPPFPPKVESTRRVLVHARVSFDVDVRGPLLLGSGRYLGLGLFRPIGVEGR